MSIYHEQLEVSEEASFEVIKEAYFEKSLEAFATGESEETFDYFFHVHKAFIFLIAKATGTFYERETLKYEPLKISQVADWENKFEDKEEQLLEDAKTLWDLKREGYQRSDFYLVSKKLQPATSEVNFWPPLFLNLINPILLFVLLGWPGLVLAISVTYITLPVWTKTFRKMFFIPGSPSAQGVAYLLNQKVFWILIFTVTNLLLFLFSTARTFIPFSILAGMFLGVMALGFLLPANKIPKLKPYGRVVLGLGLFPFILNLFFSLNLTLSSPLIEETHFIDRNYQMVEGEEEVTTYLTLEYGVYDNYLHIRHFPTLDELKEKSSITMSIHKGLFGIPVLKSWVLE